MGKPDTYGPGTLGLTLLLAGLSALGPLSTDMYLASLPALQREFVVDAAMVQLTLSVFLAGFALAMPVYGPLADRYGRLPVLRVGLVLFGIGTVACALAPTIEVLIAARMFQAIGACAGPVIARAIVRDLQASLPGGPAGAARLYSHIASAMAVAPAVAPIIGSQLQAGFGWRSTFWTLALLAVLGIVFVHRRLAETLARPDPQATDPARILAAAASIVGHAGWRANVLVCSFAYAGLFAFISGSAFVLIGHYGVAESAFGFYFLLVVIGFISGAQASGRLNGRLQIHTILRLGASIALVSGLAMAAIAWLVPHWGPLAVVLAMACYMAGGGMVLPQAQAGALSPFPDRAATASALLGLTQMTLAALAGVVMAHFYGGGPEAMATTIALCGVAAAGTAWFVLRRPHGGH